MDEYIEREALLKWALEFYPNDLQFASAVRNAHAAEVAPVRHGKWDSNGEFHQCSVCTNFTGYDYDYCPNCGAKMDRR